MDALLFCMETKLANHISQWSENEIDSFTRFLNIKEKLQSEIHSEMVRAYGEDVMCLRQVVFWCNDIQQVQMNVQDINKMQHDHLIHIHENVDGVKYLILEDK